MVDLALEQAYRERLTAALPGVRDAIAEAAAGVGRDPASVRLVAVSKGHPVEAAAAALEVGLTDLGENRVEELEAKLAQLGRRARWHLIGHLQSRKAARALAAADLIHSVDSLKLAERISRLAGELGREAIPVLLQVNVSGEDTKGGFERSSAHESLLEVVDLPRLDVRGLMTMAPFTDDERVQREAFAGLQELLQELRRQRPNVGGELSMGMTNDLRAAVAEGSTMVRIGTALFGERETAGGPDA